MNSKTIIKWGKMQQKKIMTKTLYSDLQNCWKMYLRPPQLYLHPHNFMLTQFYPNIFQITKSMLPEWIFIPIIWILTMLECI
jgi:hypothetical protein